MMRKFKIILSCALALLATATFAQPSDDIPREPGKCYAKCMIPDQYETVTEQVLTRAASTNVNLVPAQYETVTEQVLAKEAGNQLTIVPAQFETVTERVLKAESSPTLSVRPATYETVTEQVLSKEASNSLAVVPAQFETVTEQVLVKDAYSTLRVVPAVYETVTEQVLAKEASTRIEITPATYETVTEQVLLKEASSQLRVIPATYETVTEQVLVKQASTRLEKVPARYETQTEQLLTSPAATKWVKKKADKNCLSHDPNDCLVWCLVEVPAQYTTVTKQVKVGCDDGYTMNGDDCVRTVEVPEVYETRTYQKLATPATTEKVDVPAQFGTRSYTKLVSPATSETIEVPAVYETRSYQKLVSPATTEKVDVPAEYTTRTYQKLVTDAATTSTEVPAVFTNRSYQKLASAAEVISSPCGKSSILEGINFKSGSAELEQSSYAEISKLEEMLKSKPAVTAKLVGHTDSQGSETSNLTLSRNRAKAVYNVLVNSGIPAGRLSYEGKGESTPIADNSTASGRRANRRTEFITYGDNDGSGDCMTYENRSYQKLATDAATTSTEVAAQYQTRSYQKLVSDASVQTNDIAAQYKTISKRQLVKAGGFTEWREVVCASAVTSELVRQVQNALIAKGYNPGTPDNQMGPATKAALVKYQKDNGLPVGQLDYETLRSLGINQ